MSAVPKKKLCWNCEGNVSKEIDNCPYCGVYLHAAADQEEETNRWGPSYSNSEDEEIPSPPYSINPETDSPSSDFTADRQPTRSSLTLAQLKQDVFPILLLMSGSVFFLFGVILLLFSQNGSLILRWDSQYWTFFLFLSAPFIYLGWRFLEQIEPEQE